tara:strand:- start:63 stop:464 length:402 start_codon:yes stop_codon:yes gene_type:complete
MEVETSGDQINRKVNVEEIGINFTKYFYKNWQESPQNLFSSNTFKNHSRLKFKNKVYQKEELVKFFTETFSNGIIFEILEIQVLDSGARRADILVVGKLFEKKTNSSLNFSQYITLAHLSDYWFIHNSLLTIL